MILRSRLHHWIPVRCHAEFIQGRCRRVGKQVSIKPQHACGADRCLSERGFTVGCFSSYIHPQIEDKQAKGQAHQMLGFESYGTSDFKVSYLNDRFSNQPNRYCHLYYFFRRYCILSGCHDLSSRLFDNRFQPIVANEPIHVPQHMVGIYHWHESPKVCLRR
jgi:hypothetical protein